MTSALENAHAYIAALRASHDRVTSLVSDLDVAGIEAPSGRRLLRRLRRPPG